MKIQINQGTATIITEYKGKKRLKLKVSNKDDIIYDIIDTLTIPLTFGNGKYSFKLYEQINNNKYHEIARAFREINMKPEAYQLQSNSYILYSLNSPFAAKALELHSIEKIYNFIISNFYYDYIAALQSLNKKFSPPDIEKCWTKHSGTCYTLSALFVAMLRICGIAATLVIGKVNDGAHAWVEINNIKYDIAQVLQHNTKQLSYIPERYY